VNPGSATEPGLSPTEEAAMRLTGFAAIEFAEKQGLTLNKKTDDTDGPREGLTVAEAEAIASEDEDLIYLDVPENQYANAPPTDFDPER
jgi:hypothetical protein